MNKITIVCGIAMLLSLITAPAYPQSYEFDFNDDGVWDTEWSLTKGETAVVKIWLDDYSSPPDEKLLAGLMYFHCDGSKIRVNEAHSYPNDSEHGGPFDSSLSFMKKREQDVYELDVARWNFVTVSNHKILLFTIEFQCIGDEADVVIKVANDLGFGNYGAGCIGDGNAAKLYPVDALCQIEIGKGDTQTTSTSIPTSSSTTTTVSIPPPAPECKASADCSDGLFCNGMESCVAGICQAGPHPCPDDGLFCNGVEICDEENDGCLNSGNPCSGPTPVCDEVNNVCVEKAVPTILLQPDFYYQSRWIPLFMLLNIEGLDTHFDATSSITFNPTCAVWAFPLIVDEENIYMIGLLMPLWLTGPLDSVSVTVTTGQEEALETLNIELLSIILDQ